MNTAVKKWNDETVDQLTNIVGANTDSVVPVASIVAAATMLEFSEGSIAAKLRKLGYTVESMAAVKAPTFTEDEAAQLTSFLEANPGQFTYKDIASNFADGKFSPKQVQGKILHLELTSLVKPTEKVEVAKAYTDAQENQLVEMAQGGAFIEDIADALGKTVNSVRGKALSLTTQGVLDSIPAQRESHASNSVDVIAELGEAIHNMTLAEIAEATGKTERGIKTTLTRRGITVVDYNGAAKQEKAQAKRED